MKNKFILPSGFRDIDPPHARIYEKIIERIVDIFRIYGFVPLYTPHLELWDTLKGKYGEEAEKLLVWRFQDFWSKEWYALRYDHTVPLVRHFISRKYPLPFKRYTIGSVFRHERPQRGRFREFIQADVDIIGSPYPEADAELLSLIVDVMEKIGFGGKFIIRLNDRRITEGVLKDIFDIKEIIQCFRIIDKLDKIGYEGVRSELSRVIGDEKANRLVDFIVDARGSLNDIINYVQSKLKGTSMEIKQGIESLESILNIVSSRVRGYIDISLDLVRGLDYYTGAIWEVVIPKVGLGSVGGGGRYDNLIELYSGEKVPATGSSFGVDRLVEASLSLGINNFEREWPLVYIIVITKELYFKAWELAMRLRREGIPVAIDLMRRKLSKQKEYSRKIKAKILIYFGEKEVRSGLYSIYMGGKHYNVRYDDLIDFLRKNLELKN